MLNEKILISGFMLLAYLVGSISSAVLVSRLFGLPDPRQAGSHNPGATNVLRLGGKWPAALTLLGDVLKGFVPVFIAKIFLINPWGIGLIGLLAFLGHLYPLYFNFVGGKGVATFWGVLMAWHPFLALAFGFTWLLVAFLLRISSLASLVASILSIVYTYFFLGVPYAIIIVIMVLGIFLRHQGNIKRLVKGQEPRIGRK